MALSPQLMSVLLLGPERQAQLMKVEQQQRIANELLKQGLTPLDTNNRQINGVAYRISPFESLGKLASALSGGYMQKKAIDDYANIFNTPQTQQYGSVGDQAPSEPVPQQIPTQAYQAPQQNGMLGGLMDMAKTREGAAQLEMMGLNGKNVADIYGVLPTEQERLANWALPGRGAAVVGQKMINEASPGLVAQQQELGKTSAGMMPAGTQPAGMNPMLPNLIQAESGGNPDAVSPKGAFGLTQVMPQTATNPGFGVKPMQNNTPHEQVRFGNDYLNAMQNRYNDPRLAAAAYNAGPGRVDQALASLPQETQDYVKKVAPQQPIPGETIDQYKARTEANKKSLEAQAAQYGEAMGKANVNLANLKSRLPNMINAIDDMIKLAPETSVAVPFVSNELQNDFLGRTNPKVQAANAQFEQLNSGLGLQEMAPLVQSLGSRGNQFIEKAIKQNSGADIRDSAEAKIRNLQSVKSYLNYVLENADALPQLLQNPQQPINIPSTPNVHSWTPQQEQRLQELTKKRGG